MSNPKTWSAAARLAVEEQAKMWPSISQAVGIVAEERAISPGAAGAALCEACASGVIRWKARRADDLEWPSAGFVVPIRTSPGSIYGSRRGVLTREVWRRAHIAGGMVIDGDDRYVVEINAADLAFWLPNRRQAEMDGQSRGPGRPGMRRELADELRRRADEKRLTASWHAQSADLANWATVNAPKGVTPPQANTIERDDDLKDLYHRLITVAP